MVLTTLNNRYFGLLSHTPPVINLSVRIHRKHPFSPFHTSRPHHNRLTNPFSNLHSTPLHADPLTTEMAAISNTLAVRDAHIYKRNWAKQEAGVIVVFCIVFIVAVGLIGLYTSRWLSRRKAAREARADKS